MMITRWISLIVVVALGSVLGGCGKDAQQDTPSAQRSPAVSPEAVHGTADAVPGSYEDWCGEHGVAESVCTRCNPALSAAFKATDDWCAEHGLPESQCLKCNADLKIVRPPKPEGS